MAVSNYRCGRLTISRLNSPLLKHGRDQLNLIGVDFAGLNYFYFDTV
jgi:hypothetical protein